MYLTDVITGSSSYGNSAYHCKQAVSMHRLHNVLNRTWAFPNPLSSSECDPTYTFAFVMFYMPHYVFPINYVLLEQLEQFRLETSQPIRRCMSSTYWNHRLGQCFRGQVDTIAIVKFNHEMCSTPIPVVLPFRSSCGAMSLWGTFCDELVGPPAGFFSIGIIHFPEFAKLEGRSTFQNQTASDSFLTRF
jgi:hypothetical protein